MQYNRKTRRQQADGNFTVDQSEIPKKKSMNSLQV